MYCRSEGVCEVKVGVIVLEIPGVVVALCDPSRPHTGAAYSPLVHCGILGNLKKGTLLLSHSAQLGLLPLISALPRRRIWSSTCLQNQNMD